MNYPILRDLRDIGNSLFGVSPFLIWFPPCINQLKINIDALPKDGCAGIRVIIGDHDGLPTVSYASNIPFSLPTGYPRLY